ncbi:MAG: hypothetical protein ACD_50C00377G0003 [uncultured bacterium]|nr:MAG: hypothetical protein ACD_50C00377G0003 [uncultured bacterium]
MYRTDFIYIMNIAKKESRETNYWLKLLFESNNEFITTKLNTIIAEGEEIAKILTASVKSAQRKHSK